MKQKWKPKKQRPHDWGMLSRGLQIPYCERCGIIALKNEATARVINKPCRGLEEEDTQ